jgi:branched-chain amino acid transport system permease protein
MRRVDRYGHARRFAVVVGLVVLVVLPFVTEVIDEPYYVDLVTRFMIFAIAAASLDLILGYGGMISFGHAAYLGLGGYAVAIFSFYGIDNGFLQLAVAILGSALIALLIGAICLKTSGLYFIMITLAFTQMLYFLGVSLEEYGGDDGVNTNRSEFFEALDLYDPTTFYYFVFGLLVVCVLGLRRVVASRFGRVISGAKSNDLRMRAIGFPTFRYRLIAFAISGAICGIAGFLLGNLTEFVTPEYMHWSRSGELLVMVVMGGTGTIFGPVIGAVGFLLLEEWLSSLTEHWLLFFGPSLLLLVLFAKRGLFGLISPAAGGGE